MAEHVPVDVVDGVALVAAVIDLAGLPAPGFGLLGPSSLTNSMIFGLVTPVLASWSATTRPIVAEPAGPAVSGSLPLPAWTK